MEGKVKEFIDKVTDIARRTHCNVVVGVIAYPTKKDLKILKTLGFTINGSNQDIYVLESTVKNILSLSIDLARDNYAIALSAKNISDLGTFDLKCAKHLSNNTAVSIDVRKALKRKLQTI